MIPATFSLSYWNLTSKVLLLRMEFCLVTNVTLCLYFVLSLDFTGYSYFVCKKTACSFTRTFYLIFSTSLGICAFFPPPLLTLHQWIFLSLAFCPLVSPLVSPWLSHVLFQSTGAQGGNEIWRPSLNGHAHILCNYLGLTTGARFSIYKSVLLTGPSQLLKPYPADASWWDSDPWPFTLLGLLGVTCDPALGSLGVCSVWPLQASWPPKSQLCMICP